MRTRIAPFARAAGPERGILVTMLLLGFTSAACAQTTTQPGETIEPRECLVVVNPAAARRAPVRMDPIEARIVAGAWSAPQPGDILATEHATVRTWEAATANADGWFEHAALENGYAYFAIESAAERVMLLEARGHDMVYVNGAPRVGDPYQLGFVHLPVPLRRGRNDLLFPCRRGRLKVTLRSPRAALMLDTSDITLPDLVVGEAVDAQAAVVVINATNDPRDDLFLRARLMLTDPEPAAAGAGATDPSRLFALPSVPPMTVRKVPFELIGPAPTRESKATIELQLLAGAADAMLRTDAAAVELRVRQPEQTRKITFVSALDGSVQYYAINPPIQVNAGPSAGRRAPALFLTLHGAGVEAIGQADAYAPKTWGFIVAPTNRRPFGFDWEDWGRQDALEVLALTRARFHTDPRRTYLTGHSMGGHGTWNLAAIFPDRFAAIGPSAGWTSFRSYPTTAPADEGTPIDDVLRRAGASSDTLLLARNYLQQGVYILHGDADDNVPVAQARTMYEHLRAFHHDVVLHEQPGTGHWWDVSEEPGADCVDWAPMFDFFSHHAIPADDEIRHVEFTTVNPGVSARCHWVHIHAQRAPLKPSTVNLRWDPAQRRFSGTTDNVARLALTLQHVAPDRPLNVELDGEKLNGIAWPPDIGWMMWPDVRRAVWLELRPSLDSPGRLAWFVVQQPGDSLKSPRCYGSFKTVFDRHVLLVYGTHGTPEENAWAIAKARYDAETFWYRGNASIDVLADQQFRPSNETGRNIVLYGNADTNSAWQALLSDDSVHVTRGAVRVGNRTLRGDDLACLFVRPGCRQDCPPFVGVVCGTGLPGMRLTERLPYFVSGVGYPDCIVLGSDVLTRGSAGIRAAGFFGLDWSVESGEFAWRDEESDSHD